MKHHLEKITLFRQAVATAKNDLEILEAALEVVERASASASEYDGKTSPEELFERSESARRSIFKGRIEVARASTRLLESQEEFTGFLKSNYEEITAGLRAEIERRSDALFEQLSPLVEKGDSHVKTALRTFIENCDEVRERQTTLNRAGLQLTYQEFDNLAASLESALRFIEAA